ncbi:MAG TPA: DUF4062 domain-containing protein [Candidatus Sulfotelmatobacter sp.]|nr:DUF4062 domain-containing protein [Candidatus Sulfotelmatobacter sp.]
MKVYISSTYLDLIEYRAAVDRTLRRMGHDVIGMEQYVAEGSKPVERCQADVIACDVYVIIVAWRFGYQPWRTNPTPDHRSITEIERDQAKTSGKPVVAFLLDPQAPWPPNFVDAMGTEGGLNISRLRAELGAEYLAGIFRTPDDLASQVAAAVSAQGLTRHMVDRVLGETSVATPDMDAFANGTDINPSPSSMGSIKKMIRQSGTARAVVLQLDDGERWWSTRLFLLASLLQQLTAVRQIVFSDASGAFVGMASPNAIFDGLGAAFMELNNFALTLTSQPSSLDIERETDRQIDAWKNFTNAPPPIQGQKTAPGPAELQWKVGVRVSLLQQWLGERWVGRCIRVDSADLTMSQVQQIVDSLLPDVPVQRQKKAPQVGYELLVVDRDAFALQLAREWVRSGLPRSPVR